MVTLVKSKASSKPVFVITNSVSLFNFLKFLATVAPVAFKISILCSLTCCKIEFPLSPKMSLKLTLIVALICGSFSIKEFCPVPISSFSLYVESKSVNIEMF